MNTLVNSGGTIVRQPGPHQSNITVSDQPVGKSLSRLSSLHATATPQLIFLSEVSFKGKYTATDSHQSHLLLTLQDCQKVTRKICPF